MKPQQGNGPSGAREGGSLARLLVVAPPGPLRDARAASLGQAGFEIALVDAGAVPGSNPCYRTSAEALSAAAAEAIDRVETTGPAIPLAIYGIGVGTAVAVKLAFSQAGIAALVLENPLSPVSTLQRILLHRERFRIGSDMPSRIMRQAGAETVGNWLAIAAMQRALPTLPGEGRRVPPPTLVVGRRREGERFREFLRSRGAADVEAAEDAAMPQTVIAWLQERLA